MTTLATPAGTITHNAASGDTLWVDPKRSVGLGMGEIRNPIDDKAQTDGFLLHDFFEKGAMLLPAGVVLARTDTTGNTGRDALMADTVTKLRSILRATGTLNFGSGATLVVKCHMRADFPTIEGDLKGFVYGLVSASPPP